MKKRLARWESKVFGSLQTWLQGGYPHHEKWRPTVAVIAGNTLSSIRYHVWCFFHRNEDEEWR